jgi:hypothetical protein
MGESCTWKSAEVLHLTGGSVYQSDIHLLPANNELTGPGSITGKVVSEGSSEIIPFAAVLLYDDKMVPVRSSFSDHSGAFGFQGMAFGAYHLYVEIPGKYSRLTAIWLDSSMPVADSLKLEVFNHDVTGVNDLHAGGAVVGDLFPNPAGDAVSLPIHLPVPETLRFVVRSLSGVTVWSGSGGFEAGPHQVQIPLAATRPGIYFVVIQSHDGAQVAVKKLIRR